MFKQDDVLVLLVLLTIPYKESVPSNLGMPVAF